MEETTLFVRHLPAELSVDERKDLLHNFGATRVRAFGGGGGKTSTRSTDNTGKMAHTAFATFPNKELATEVLSQLHQAEILGSTLVVEFAHDTRNAPSVVDDEGKLLKMDGAATLNKAKMQGEKKEKKFKPEEIKFDTTFKTWGISHPRPPQLKYQYPPPTAMVLTNIMNALASVPKFYVQVLHLMNKMDLPCPFGQLTATPPLHVDMSGMAQYNHANGLAQPDDVGQREMDISSESESELESDDDKATRTKEENQKIKRLHRKALRRPRLKKPRLADLQDDVMESANPSVPSLPVAADVFDQVSDQSHVARKIELKISQERVKSNQNAFAHDTPMQQAISISRVSDHLQQPTHSSKHPPQVADAVLHQHPRQHAVPSQQPPPPLPPLPVMPAAFAVPTLAPRPLATGDNGGTVITSSLETPNTDSTNERQPANEGSTTMDCGDAGDSVTIGGFGIIQPLPKDSSKKEEQEESDEKQWGKSKFISSSELRKGRLSQSEMRDLSVYKRYEPGEASCRLYIKNVSKQADEDDLHWLYGRYVDWDSEAEQNIFDIRLMKEGRMKGQAFVTMPSEEVAKDALRNTNGFLLKDKPLVVQFARTAKAQEDALSTITSKPTTTKRR